MNKDNVSTIGISSEPVYIYILKPLEDYYGSGYFENEEQARFVMKKWIDHLKFFPENVLKRVFDQVILLNRYNSWPSLNLVHETASKIQYPLGRMMSPAGG